MSALISVNWYRLLVSEPPSRIAGGFCRNARMPGQAVHLRPQPRDDVVYVFLALGAAVSDGRTCGRNSGPPMHTEPEVPPMPSEERIRRQGPVARCTIGHVCRSRAMSVCDAPCGASVMAKDLADVLARQKAFGNAHGTAKPWRRGWRRRARRTARRWRSVHSRRAVIDAEHAVEEAFGDVKNGRGGRGAPSESARRASA